MALKQGNDMLKLRAGIELESNRTLGSRFEIAILERVKSGSLTCSAHLDNAALTCLDTFQ
jgi:hypothetical protein